MLKFQVWGFENGRACIRRVRNLSGTLPRPRGHKIEEQFLKIVEA